MSARCLEADRSCAHGYNQGCRCAACKAYNSARSDARRRKQGARVQLRKRKDVILCPETGLTPPTAFRDGCRCAVCRAYLREKSLRYRARLRREAQVGLTDLQMEMLYGELWAEAEHAIRTDPEIAIRIAIDAAEAFELFNSRNDS